MNVETQYAKDYPGGLCATCRGNFVRVSKPHTHAGEFAYTEINGRRYHVICGERYELPITADVDRWAQAHGTAKKPAHL